MIGDTTLDINSQPTTVLVDPPVIVGESLSTTTVAPNAYISFEVVRLEALDERGLSVMAQVEVRLKEISEFSKNWDSYGSPAPTPESLAALRVLVNKLVARVSRRSAAPFSIVPLSGGGAQMEWRRDDDAIEVESDARGMLSYLLVRNESSSTRHSEERDNVPENEI